MLHLHSYINVFLTALFLWPLFRSEVVTAPVKRVAIRTLVFVLPLFANIATDIVLLQCICSRPDHINGQFILYTFDG